jgi:hypothetical protein
VRSGPANCLFELRSAVAAGKPLETCCVEPGFRRSWLAADVSGARAVADGHELVALARLGPHLFVDLGEASRVHSTSEASVRPAERRTLQAPEALPRLLRLVAESRAALKAAEEAAALRGQQLHQTLRARAQAALEAASASRAASAARLADVEGLAGPCASPRRAARPSSRASATLRPRQISPRRVARRTWTRRSTTSTRATPRCARPGPRRSARPTPRRCAWPRRTPRSRPARAPGRRPRTR